MDRHSDRSYRVFVLTESSDLKKFVENGLLGFEIEFFDTPNQMAERLAAEKVSLIVVDADRPNIADLFQYTYRLKERHDFFNVPLLYYTEKDDPDFIVRCYQAGASDCIRKNVSGEEFQVKVGNFLRMAEYTYILNEIKEFETIRSLISAYRHEINNPLAIAIGNLNKLRYHQAEDAKGIIDTIDGALGRIKDVIRKIKGIKVPDALPKSVCEEVEFYDIQSLTQENDPVIESSAPQEVERPDVLNLDKLKELNHENKRVLVVDDEPEIRELLIEELESEGFEVDGAENGQVALDKVQVNDYLFALTDLDMPVMNGLTFIREAKLVRPELPVAICSGRMNEFVSGLATVTVAGAIPKPFDLKDLYKTVNHLVERRTQLDEIVPDKPKLVASDVMSSKIFTSKPDELVKDVLSIMGKQSHGATIVDDPKNGPGIFTERDLLHQFGEDGFETKKMKDVMTSNIYTCNKDDSIEIVKNLMDKHNIRHIPVLENNTICGIISIRAVLRHELRALAEMIALQTDKLMLMKDSEKKKKAA